MWSCLLGPRSSSRGKQWLGEEIGVRKTKEELEKGENYKFWAFKRQLWRPIHNREGQGQTHLLLLFPPIFLLFHYYSIFYFYFRSYILYLNYIWTVVFAERYFHSLKEIACDDLYQLFWIIGILENQQVHKNAWHPLIIVTDMRVVLCQAADIHCDKFWDPFFLWCNRDIVAVMHFLMTWQYSQVCIIEMRARWTWNRFWCKFGSQIFRVSFAWV